MNHGVAADARDSVRRTGIHPMDGSGRDRAVALVAQLIDIGNIHQSRILRAMRRVAAEAAFPLHCGMFKHEGSAGLGVALGADSILIRG